jgi:hypothetical protein
MKKKRNKKQCVDTSNKRAKESFLNNRFCEAESEHGEKQTPEPSCVYIHTLCIAKKGKIE